MTQIPQCDDCHCTDFIIMYPVELVPASKYFAELGKPKLSNLTYFPQKQTAVCKACNRSYEYEV